MSTDIEPSLGADLLIGADALAAFLGLTKRQVYGAAERGTLPFFRIGTQVCARKSVLLAWIEAKEAEFRTRHQS